MSIFKILVLYVSEAVSGEETRGGTRHLFMILLQASDIGAEVRAPSPEPGTGIDPGQVCQ